VKEARAMGELSPTHWLIVIAVVVLLFGAKRLPDAARSMGQALRVFKAETGELRHDRPATGTPEPREVTEPQARPEQ
jgi:sec-independent protein translocase protein TatA